MYDDFRLLSFRPLLSLFKKQKMGFGNRSKGNTPSINQDQTYEDKVAKFKQTLYQIANSHLIENQNNSPFLYYFCLFLQHLSLLWFIVHPGLNIFGDVYLLDKIRLGLKIVNFQEQILGGQDVYMTIIGIIIVYLVTQIILICISSYSILNKSTGEFSKYVKKIVNFQIIFNVRVLSGPIIAVAVNVLYCQEDSPYRITQTCYEPTHIAFCVVSAIILIIIIVQILIFGIFYFIKNPLSSSYMGEYNRYYTLSKGLIKILLPIYFAVDYNLSLSIVYVFMVTALLGVYIGWHRFFSIHSYQQRHFYVQYFMESTLAWMAVNNILSYYIEGPNTAQSMSFVYGVFSSLLIAILLMNIEKAAEDRFIQECLEKKLKKQNMQRFIFILINRFLHESSKQAKLTFKVYSKIISKNIEKYKQIQEKLLDVHEKTEKYQIYQFLCILVQSCLQQNNSVILKTLKCYLLCFLGQKSFGLHQSLELQQERLSISEEFMINQFKTNQNVFGSEKSEKFSAQFVKYYRFHEELGELQDLIELCAKNNLEYWQELCEGDPSVSKLRNLATFYNNYEKRISEQYIKVIGVFPQNLYSTSLYLKFLMNVGVDTKQALKLKQKMTTILQARSRSVRVSECQFSEDEDIAIITVDSIGNNLGVVLNCNNNVQQSLGYEKNGLIGKNVTKIMPKIYSQLHNNFMLNFIRSQTSHIRPSDKMVTALNKDSLLVELKLTVRMMTSSQSALSIVGFMRKITRQKNNREIGLLMLSLNTLEILGIDSQFEKLMNFKLSGKQLAQEQIKLASIMPELDLELLQKELSANSVLQVGTANQHQDMQVEVTKKIKVDLKSTKLYNGVNIAFLSIGEDRIYQQATSFLQKITPSYGKMTKIVTPDFLRLGPKNNNNITHDQISINMKINQKQQNHPEDGLSRQLPMAKKIEEYVTNKQNNKIKTFINFIHIITIIGLATIVLFIYTSHRLNLSQMNMMYNEMSSAADMSYYVARINLLTNLVWSAEKVGPQSNYSAWMPTFVSDYEAMKDNFGSLVKTTNQYSQNLEYNQINQQTFVFVVPFNGNLYPVPTASSNMNLFNGYIEASGQFIYSNLNDVVQVATLQIQSLFLRKNGDEILPNVTDNAVILYKNFFNSYILGQFQRMSALKGILLASSAVIMLLISIIGNHINKINKEVIEIYKKIRLWDISELSIKCSQFLTAKGLKVTKRRNSSLLRIFPVKTFLQIIGDGKKQKQKQVKSAITDKKLKSKQQVENSMVFRQAMSPDPLMTPIPASLAEHDNDLVMINNDNQETLLKGTEVQPTIQMYFQFNNKWIISGMVLIFLTIGGIVGFSIYSSSNSKDDISSKVQILKDVGQVRKIINFINYLSFRTLQNPKDQAVRTLLNSYINQFYQYSGETYSYLGDPQPVLKGVYTYVETIQQWLSMPNVSSTDILLANFQTIYNGLKSGSDEIEQLSNNMFLPAYNDSIFSDQQLQLIFAIIIFLVICLFIFILDCLYLKPIYKQSKHSLNMIRILPAWIFQRNAQAFDQLAD